MTDKTNDEILADELMRRAVKAKPTRKVYVYGPSDIWTSDIVEMKPDHGHKYILFVMDLYSRFVWGCPLQNKTPNNVRDFLLSIIRDNNNVKPKFLWTDKGTEYYGGVMKTFLRNNNIKIYSTYSPHKACVMERFNRTFKEWMEKRFIIQNNRTHWIQHLPEILEKYNNTYHRSINTTPQIRYNQTKFEYPGFEIPQRTPKFKVGDRVRISLVKGKFDKGFQARWSLDIYEITAIKQTNPYTYKLYLPSTHENLDGSFYEQELQKTRL